MKEYKLLDLIRTRLIDLDNKSIDWLGAQIGKSRNWFYSIKSIEHITLVDIRKMSEALEIDLLADYGRFLNNNDEIVSPFLLNEPLLKMTAEKPITVQIRLRASFDRMHAGLPQMLKEIKSAGEKLGFEIE